MQQTSKLSLGAAVTLLFSVTVIAFAAPAAMAQSLLSKAQHARLAGWLSEEALNLTAIYTRLAGDTSRDSLRYACNYQSQPPGEISLVDCMLLPGQAA